MDIVNPKNFTIVETQWFDSLKKSYPAIELDVWNETKLRALLRKHTRIRYDYFQLSGFGIYKSISNKILEQTEAAALIILLAYLAREEYRNRSLIMRSYCMIHF